MNKMSSTNPQEYDPYLDKLQKYERKLDEMHSLITSYKNKIPKDDRSLQDYKKLIDTLEALQAEIKLDIKKRKTDEPPRPDYGKLKGAKSKP